MAITTQRAIYAGLLADLKTGVTSIHNDYIYVTPRPIFSQIDVQYLQLIPGVPTALTDVTGIGLIEETFSIAVWVQVFLDQQGRSDSRLFDATFGALTLCGEVWQAMIQTDANGLATTQVTFQHGSLPQEQEDSEGWAFYENTFKLQYEIAWS